MVKILVSRVQTYVGSFWLLLIPIRVFCRRISRGYIGLGYTMAKTKYAQIKFARASSSVLVKTKNWDSTHMKYSVISSLSATTMNGSLLFSLCTSSSTSTQPCVNKGTKFSERISRKIRCYRKHSIIQIQLHSRCWFTWC